MRQWIGSSIPHPSGQFLKDDERPLKEALAGDSGSNILLEPRDRILIQQNAFHADTPTVVIAGEVVNPGRYPLIGSLHVSDLVRLAGGFKRSAYTELLI